MRKETDPFEIIKKELSNHDTSALVEFMDKFLPTSRNYFLSIYKFGRRNWLNDIPFYKGKVTKKYVIFSSVEDFWQRWNRFKKLIAFL